MYGLKGDFFHTVPIIVKNINNGISCIVKDGSFIGKDQDYGISLSTVTFNDFMTKGVINENEKIFTYYSEKVLPGKGLKIPGRHTDGGFVRDKDNFVVLAAGSNISKGTVIDLPILDKNKNQVKGKVYDTIPNPRSKHHFDVYIE